MIANIKPKFSKLKKKEKKVSKIDKRSNTSFRKLSPPKCKYSDCKYVSKINQIKKYPLKFQKLI